MSRDARAGSLPALMPGAVHGQLAIYDTRFDAPSIHLRAMTGVWAMSASDARRLAADLLNRADLIDPRDGGGQR